MRKGLAYRILGLSFLDEVLLEESLGLSGDHFQLLHRALKRSRAELWYVPSGHAVHRGAMELALGIWRPDSQASQSVVMPSFGPVRPGMQARHVA